MPSSAPNGPVAAKHAYGAAEARLLATPPELSATLASAIGSFAPRAGCFGKERNGQAMTPLFTRALLSAQSDERLVLLVRDGQERAFDAIVDRYRKPLQRYCERALPKSRAEDVVQQVLTKAWCALRDGTEVRSLKPWLYRIAATTMLETARAPGYAYDELRRSLQVAEDPEAELEQQAIIRRTLAGLAALPEAQREALLRDAFEGQSRAQIAEALGVSEGAVRQLLHRARANLRAAATAITPLPLVSWLAMTGSAPAAESALESGAAGTVGVAGIAKLSAVVATAGVVVSGSTGDQHRHAHEARKARADRMKHSIVLPHRAQVRVSRVVPPTNPSDEERVTQQAEHRDAGSEGASESEQGIRGDHEVSRPETRGQDAHQSDQQQSDRQQHAEPDEERPETQRDEGDASGQSASDSGDGGE
jgi:RNA polymerase sigma factor (sigma-70 family)